jgi:hypothetical protein
MSLQRGAATDETSLSLMSMRSIATLLPLASDS